jgi:hypothetical protein
VDIYKDNEFTVEQWVYDFIAINTTVNNTLLTTIGNTSLILTKELSYITLIE